MSPSLQVQQLWQQARQLEHDGQAQRAEQAYRQLLALEPDFHPAWHALGLLAVAAQQLPLAGELIEQALAHGPDEGLYWRNLGEIRRRQGQLAGAAQAATQACELLPDDPLAWYNLGLACAEQGDHPRAEPAYRRALALAPGYGAAWNNLGSLLELRNAPGDREAAQVAYRQAISLDPRHAQAQNNLGALYAEQGRLDEARACFEAAIATQGDFVAAHYNYSSLHTYRPDDPHLALLQGLHAGREQWPYETRVRYSFALGKALDDAGAYDAAFAAYDEGNRLQYAAHGYDDSAAQALQQRIIATFDADFFAARAHWQGAVDPQRRPVFIVGMPRSGTTLLEQILCSHAQVHGAGELPTLGTVITAGCGAPGYPEGATGLDEDQIRDIGQAYLREVWQLAPDSALITDKMPANFFYLGLLHLALPGARIIHARRDPMDSCFSCYARLFGETMDFAYDQQALGRYYVRYRQLMEHWQQVLPAGTFLDLDYEALIADPEGQARRVLQFVGLPWDPRCLEFHRNPRPVKTASVAQVRRPLYSSSVARWKHFARHLWPLYQQVKAWRDSRDDEPQLLQAMQLAQADSLHQAGIALYHQGRFEQALALFEQTLALLPQAASVHNSKGFALQDLGRTEAARDCFAQALALDPHLAMARLNLGLAQLKLGDWQAGWANYEARWTGSAEASLETFKRPDCPLPQWHGQPASGQSLLVIIEQGFGDTFQFARYLNLLVTRFARVGLACSTPVLRLMQDSFGEQVVIFHGLPEHFEGWDWQCPLMSLPGAFATRVDSVPAQLPYLKVPQPAAEYWRSRLQAAAPGRLRIGLAWAGRADYRYNQRRSLDFAHLQPLFEAAAGRVSWVNLQKWPAGVQASRPGPEVDWLDWTGDLGDFATTAALVANLDLVISVDSVLVHLAGGLDVPVWMLDRFDNEWRWLKDRLDSPWYPRLRIFRQATFGAWPGVIEQVCQALPAALATPPAVRP
ncbi:sulfotransferase [Pseudomonas sp. HR96]|uniref:sulfotransferase n=1 Tax=Pseudomonas sp. HR96 TaxID=1027966 RepID=UPI002A75F244|nr:sulfotransferase [Pseudomonas sp. HR96]WPP01981.1 sulfotransferase [Pseudomonas sp. HR96]